MDYMRRFILLEQFTRLFLIPVSFRIGAHRIKSAPIPPGVVVGSNNAHLRSPSLELANTQVSPVFFPNLEFSGSVLTTCSMAFPTRPVPPVTRMTVDIVVYMFLFGVVDGGSDVETGSRTSTHLAAFMTPVKHVALIV